MPWQAPDEVLMMGVDQLAGVVNGLPGVAPQQALHRARGDTPAEEVPTGEEQLVDCPPISGPSFDLVLGYPDGRTRIVTGTLSGCAYVQVGDQMRVGADQVWDAFRELLHRQRVGESVQPVSPVACPADPFGLRAGWMSAAVRGQPVPYPAVVATVCRYAGAGQAADADQTSLAQQTQILDGELADALRGAVNSSPRATVDCSLRPDAPVHVLVFRDAAGGTFPVAVDWTVCGTMTGPTVSGQLASQELRHLIHEALFSGGPGAPSTKG